MVNLGVFSKTNISKKLLASIIIFSLFSVILTLQNKAFLFNPFILIIFCSSCVVSFYTLLGCTITSTISAFIINIYYGFEILFISLAVIIFYFLSMLFSKKKIRNYIPLFFVSISLFIIYFFTSNDVFYRINSLVLVLIILLFGINIINIVDKFLNKEEIDNTSLGLFVGYITTLFINLDSFSFLWITFILLIVLKINKKEVFLISLLTSFSLIFNFSHSNIDMLFLIYFSLFLVGLIAYKYNYLLYIVIISLLLLSTGDGYYLDPIYLQIVIGYLLTIIIPNNLLEKIKSEINYYPKNNIKDVVEFQNNKITQISKLCDLLMDDRFDKYEKIDIQLAKVIKKNVCSKCSKKDQCELNISSFLSGYLSNNEKLEINEKCIYPYQITKSINDVNKRIVDYSERELRSVESRKIMNNAYQIIKKYIDIKPQRVYKNKRYSLDIASVSVEANESPNGDYYKVYECNDNTIIALSDGMGHTAKSRDISEYLVELISYLTFISNDISLALESSNQILLAKTYEEVYATLDLCEIDLELGKIFLYKAGSFPTYIIRNKTVKEFSTKLPPIGIIKNIHIDSEIIDIKNKDIIIFCTDGFSDNIKSVLENTVQKASFLPLKNYLKFLYKKLEEISNNEDDKTLIGIKITKN